MRALIFTEGGSQIGLGHISRCSSLYDELRDRGIEVEFIINSNMKHFEIIKNKNYKIVNWLSIDFLENYIKKNDLCIVDSYLANEDLYRVISSCAKKALFIDDNGRIKYPEGIVVNPSLSNTPIEYPLSDTNCYLLGPEYVILRSPFVQVSRAHINFQVKEVLITLGGADVHSLTPSILTQLSSKNPEIIFNVVIGSAFRNCEEIKSSNNKNITFYENATAMEMKSIMLSSDLAITAAGQTIFELLATQTPFIPVKVAENQHDNILALKESDLIQTDLEHGDSSLIEKLMCTFDNLLEYCDRLDFVNKSQNIVDGLGSQRIIDTLTQENPKEKKLFLRKVKEKDCYETFQLSNEGYVRKYSINNKQIDWEEHKIWFDNIIKSNYYEFYVVTDKVDNFLGQLRYKIEEHSAIVSISLCQKVAGRGLSSKLLIESIKLIHKERKNLTNIVAYVSVDNIPSKKLFEKVGFTLIEDNNGMLKYVYSIN